MESRGVEEMKLYSGSVKMFIDGKWYPIDLNCEMALFIGTQLSLDTRHGSVKSIIVEIINIAPAENGNGEVFWTRTLSNEERMMQIMVQSPWKGCTCEPPR